MGRRVMILTAGVGAGHNSAGTALAEACAARSDVEDAQQIDVLELTNDLYRTMYDDMYFALVEAAPWLVSWGYERNEPPFRPHGVQQLWDELNTMAVVTALRDFAPTTLICTHFLPARLASLLLERGVVQATLSVITTDFDLQGLWLSVPFHRFFVARDETRAHMLALGLPPDRISVSGIPVAARFSQPLDRAAVRARYGLAADRPLVLLSAGAAGADYVEPILQQVLALQLPLQVLVVCGRNDPLRERLTALTEPRRADCTVIGFSEEMPDLLRCATVFIGKPGGLSSAECMAAGLPMLLVRPIPGQETRNSDVLLEAGAAWRCHYLTTVGFTLERLLRDPARLQAMACAAEALGRRAAAADVIEQALNEAPAGLWISREAQRAMRMVGEGRPTPAPVTLYDTVSGQSRAVLTVEQLGRLREISGDAAGRPLVVSARRLRRWRTVGLEQEPVTLLRRVLNGAARLTLDETAGVPVAQG